MLHQNGQDTAHYTDSIGFVEVPEFLREQKQITPDELMTGEQITTPRGSFSVTAMSREQMEAAGYGFHHQSDNGKYLIMGNGTRAFAIAAEQPENHLKAAELSTEQNANMIDGIINNTPAADGLEAAGEQISLEQYAETLKQDETQKNAEPDTACITAASKSRYDGMVALFTLDDKIHIGKSENYDNKGHYDNTDNSLLYVSDCQAAFTFLTSEGCIHPQDEALKQGIYTQEDYKEFARITDFLAQAGFTPEKNFVLTGSPFPYMEIRRSRQPRKPRPFIIQSMRELPAVPMTQTAFTTTSPAAQPQNTGNGRQSRGDWGTPEKAGRPHVP